MSFFSKPSFCIFFFLLLQILTLAAGYRLDPTSCTGTTKQRVEDAMEEVEEMVAYAEQRALPRAPFPRKGTLLQDLLHAGSEDDRFALTKAGTWFEKVKGIIARPNIVIHCNDKHLTNGGQRNVYFDNSNGRQGRVQVLDSSKRTSTACGGIMRAFAYDFKIGGTFAGDAIVLCADAVGALKVARSDRSLKDWRDKNLLGITKGIDMIEEHLSYMLLHELMHVVDINSFPVNPGGKHELYGYGEITGNKVGQTGAKGPAGSVLIHNADSFAYLACAWYLHRWHFQDGKFALTSKAESPPPTLVEIKNKIEGRSLSVPQVESTGGNVEALKLEVRDLEEKTESERESKLTARAPKASKAKKPKAKPKANTPKEPKTPTKKPTTKKPKTSTKKPTTNKPNPTPTPSCPVQSKTPTKPQKGIKGLLKRAVEKVVPKSNINTDCACAASVKGEKPKKGIRGLLERAVKKVIPKGKGQATNCEPIQKIIGDLANEWPKMVFTKFPTGGIPEDKAIARSVVVVKKGDDGRVTRTAQETVTTTRRISYSTLGFTTLVMPNA